MAKNNQKQAKNTKKKAKVGFFTKFKKFVRDLKSELKRIIWPNKEKMIHSTAVVLSVIIAAVLVIWAVDSLVNGVLTATGFYKPMNVETQATTTPATSAGEVEESTTEGSVSVSDPTEEESKSE